MRLDQYVQEAERIQRCLRLWADTLRQDDEGKWGVLILELKVAAQFIEDHCA